MGTVKKKKKQNTKKDGETKQGGHLTSLVRPVRQSSMDGQKDISAYGYMLVSK